MDKAPTPSPGEWLYQAIIGALKGRGIKFQDWCRSHGLNSQNVRSYAYGINSGPQSAENRLIADNAYYVRIKPRSRYSKVIAKWQDRGAGRTRQVTLEAAEKGPSMTLREVFQSEAEARKAAEAKVKELRAGEGELSCDLVGSPKAHAEAPIKVLGVAPDADGDWIASSVTHVWDYSDGGGATTTVEAEFGMEEKDDKKGSKKKTPSTSSSQQSGEYVSILDR